MNKQNYFIYTSVIDNSNKFWYIKQDNAIVSVEWGGVGCATQKKSWTYSSDFLAEKDYDKKCKSKLKKGYEKVDVVGGVPDVVSSNNTSLVDLALKEIEYECDTTKSLIKFLTEQNIHEILERTTMKYNAVSGVFTTAIGVVVSQATIDKAREILVNIKSKDQTLDINDLTGRYLRLIPQDLGRGKNRLNPERVWNYHDNEAFLLKIRQQSDLLDSLEASVKTVLTKPVQSDIVDEERRRTFDCKINVVSDVGVIDHVEALYRKTRQGIHESSSFNISKVYTIDISNMRLSWESDGAKMDNIQRLWHGTKPSNVLSIMKKGLIIPPANASYCAGRAYGNGVYFSDQSTKSLNYACGYWDGNRVNRCFMFLADVAMGKSFTPSGYDRTGLPRTGYDSTFAQAGKSGVLNNEMVIYKCSRANLVYLVEFTK